MSAAVRSDRTVCWMSASLSPVTRRTPVLDETGPQFDATMVLERAAQSVHGLSVLAEPPVRPPQDVAAREHELASMKR